MRTAQAEKEVSNVPYQSSHQPPVGHRDPSGAGQHRGAPCGEPVTGAGTIAIRLLVLLVLRFEVADLG